MGETLNNFIANFIWVVHIIIILFVVCVPFTNSNYFLLLHAIFVPFMMLHWVTNNNTCCLTVTEKFLRNVKTDKDAQECFTCKLIEPIYDFKKNHEAQSAIIYVITIILWIISVSKLGYKIKSGEINSLRTLISL